MIAFPVTKLNNIKRMLKTRNKTKTILLLKYHCKETGKLP